MPKFSPAPHSFQHFDILSSNIYFYNIEQFHIDKQFLCSKSSGIGTWILFIKSWYLHCSLSILPIFLTGSALLLIHTFGPFKILKMYLPILTLLHLLISYALANGCHTGHDIIGCPTMMPIGTIHQAISDFCTLNFQVAGSSPTRQIRVGTSWPGRTYFSQAIYEDSFGNLVEFWTNFRVDRTGQSAPYTLDYNLCISLLNQAATGNGTTAYNKWKDCSNSTTANGNTFGGWGNTDFGTVFAEAICPDGISCLPLDTGLAQTGCT